MTTPTPYDWYRDGNTVWTTCPACQFKYPITVTLAEHPNVIRICPSCHHEFLAAEAAENTASQ